MQTGAVAADDAHVPELREDEPAGGVDFTHHMAPGGNRLTVQHRHAVLVHAAGTYGRWVVNAHALGDDQPDIGGGAAAVVGGDILTGDAAGGEITGHRRHDEAVAQGERAELEWLE